MLHSISAIGVPDADAAGGSDPYVRLRPARPTLYYLLLINTLITLRPVRACAAPCST